MIKKANADIKHAHQEAERETKETLQCIDMEKDKAAVTSTLTLQLAKKKKKSVQKYMIRNDTILLSPKSKHYQM